MARCGCAGATCNCVLQNGAGTTVSGAGTAASPYRVAVNLDPAAGNLLTATDDGLLVDCDAVAACVAGQTPGGLTDFNDSPGVNFTKTGTGTVVDPFQVTADLIPVFAQNISETFTHPIVAADGVWEDVTEFDDVIVPMDGTYEITMTARGAATIPGVTAAANTRVVAAIYRNGAIIPGTETMLSLVSQGAAGTAQPSMQVQASGTCTLVVALSAGDAIQLWAQKQAPTAGSTHTIVSATDGRSRISLRRIGA